MRPEEVLTFDDPQQERSILAPPVNETKAINCQGTSRQTNQARFPRRIMFPDRAPESAALLKDAVFVGEDLFDGKTG